MLHVFRPNVKPRFPLAVFLALLALTRNLAFAQTFSALWHEGEDFTQAPGNGVKTTGEKAPASAGAALWGLAFGKKIRAVRYDLNLPAPIPAAHLTFRFARQFWKPDITASNVRLQLAIGGKTIDANAVFGDTKGWGDWPAQWSLASVDLPDLPAGNCALTLTSTADDGDVCLDGFLLAPQSLKLSPDEFTPLQRLRIGNDGYLGLHAATGILDQKSGAPLSIFVRCFSAPPETIHAALTKSTGESIDLTPAAKPALLQAANAQRLEFKFPALADGNYTLRISAANPALTLEAPVSLAGDLLASLDNRIARLEDFAKSLPNAGPAAQACQPDFTYALAYLKRQSQNLHQCAASADDTAALKFLAAAKMLPPPILLANLQNTLAQYEQTALLLKDHKDPAASRIGDLRYALDTKLKPDPTHYRVFVPDAYTGAANMPLILTLHGANDDEDGMMSLEGAVIVHLAQERGYILLAPDYLRNDANYMDELLQVIARVRTQYPKIDPNRIFAYGFSMGGTASSQIASAHPELFAAACAGGGLYPIDSDAAKNLPILAIIGSEDPGLKIIAPRVEKILELKLPFDLHVEPGVPHTLPAKKYMTMAMDFFEKHPKQ